MRCVFRLRQFNWEGSEWLKCFTMDWSLITLSLPLIWFCHIHISSSEPVVTLHFYRSTVFKLSVKEYVNVDGTGNITVGCVVSNFSPLSSGLIQLSSGHTTLKESSLLELPLTWRGILSAPSHLSCTATLWKESNLGGNINSWNFNITSTVRLTTLEFQPSNSDHICLPREDGGKFLQNEVVPIICSSDEFSPKWTSNAELLINPEWFFKQASDRRVIQNFVRLTEPLSGKEATCTRRKNDTHLFCKIQLVSLKSEHDVVKIDIDPVTIPKDASSAPLRFTCSTNVPTERINWRADTSWGNILELNNEFVPRWNFSISHHMSSSELTLPSKANRLIAVSCWTYRTGSVVRAVASNQSETHETLKTQHYLNMQTSSVTSPYYIIATVSLGVTCVTLLFAIIFILRRKSQLSQRGSEVVGYVVSDHTSTQNIHPSVYTSIPELNTSCNAIMGSKQDIRTKRTRRSADELSIGILDEDSEDYIYNTIYDCIE